MQTLLARLVLPAALYIAYIVGVSLLLPPSVLQSGLLWIGLVLLLLWWSIHLMRWARKLGAPQALVYLITQIIVAGGICLLFFLVFVSLYQSASPMVAVLLLVIIPAVAAAAAAGWLIGSVIHLVKTRRQYNFESIFWRLLESEAWIWGVDSSRSARLVDESHHAPSQGATAQRTDSFTVTGADPAAPPVVIVPPAARPKPASPSHSQELYRPLWTDDATSVPAATKIPARPQTNQPSNPLPIVSWTAPEPQPAGRPLLPQAGNYFVAAARQVANERGRRCDFTPFAHYWPTYDNMLPAQRRWYFYWRAELRAGRFLPTDLSYLFIHIYELINLVGAPDHVAAYRNLVQLWLTYRPAFPKLDNYLADWIADFIVVQRLGIDLFTWYAFVCQIGAGRQVDPNLLLEAHAAGRLPLEEFPPETLYHISTYSPRQSKFYRTYAQEMQLDKAYAVGLAAVDAVQRSKAQKGLLQSFHSGRAYTLKRAPFASALHGYDLLEIAVAKIHPWTADPQLAESVASALRHTENVLRSQAKYRSLLRGVSVPPHWDAAIAAVLAPKPQRRMVEIDHASAEALRAESEAVRRRLTVASEDDEPVVESAVPDQSRSQPSRSQPPAWQIDAVAAAALAQQSEDVRRRLLAAAENERVAAAVPAAPLSNTPARAFARPADTPEGLLTDLPAVAAVLGDPPVDATRLLRHLHEHNWQAPAASINQLFAGSFASVIFDRINAAALDMLGDALLFDEDGEWVVADDYRDEVAYLLDHSDDASPGGEPPPLPAKLPPLDAGWQAFAAQLQPWHYQALAVLVLDGTGEAANAKLDAIARSRLSTANQLIDDINALALETVGDNVLDASGPSPAQYEEHTASLAALAQWALENEEIEVVA